MVQASITGMGGTVSVDGPSIGGGASTIEGPASTSVPEDEPTPEEDDEDTPEELDEVEPPDDPDEEAIDPEEPDEAVDPEEDPVPSVLEPPTLPPHAPAIVEAIPRTTIT